MNIYFFVPGLEIGRADSRIVFSRDQAGYVIRIVYAAKSFGFYQVSVQVDVDALRIGFYGN
jgi:hypothetical protein